MWTPVVINETNYLLKCVKESNITIYITDFLDMWSEELTPIQLVERFQNRNPLFDITRLTSDELIEQVTSLINDCKSVLYTLSKQSSGITLALKSAEEFPLKFEFCLIQTDNSTFFYQFTLPAVQTVQYLEMRQKKLLELLEKKDKEIKEHILENGELTRQVVVTKEFDRESFMHDFPQDLLVNVFGKSKIFHDRFSEKFGVYKYSASAEEWAKKKLKPYINTL
uniref:Non-homologous end-joining factor 1 n=1 Tax=Photinus pyralis TaxID=7054 RepID=A0A1Y1N569_PHOPY